MVNPRIDRNTHDPHLYVVHCNFWLLLHDHQQFILLAVIPVDHPRVKSEEESGQLVTPKKNVGLRSVSLGPGGGVVPIVVTDLFFLQSVVL